MGFVNTPGSSKPTTFLKIITEKEKGTERVTGKFFESSQKQSDGQILKQVIKSPSGYPLPFYGYLTGITTKLDNKVTVNGKETNIPIVMLNLKDDDNERYVLSLNWTTTDGKINAITGTILNSLAGIEKFGLLKLSIFKTENDKGTNFNVSVKNDPNWVAGSKNYDVFNKDKEGNDPTKCLWKYNIADLPTVMVTKIVDGEEVEIKNKNYQQFYIDMINSINELVKNSPVTETTTTTQTTTTSTTMSDEEWEKQNAPKNTKKATSKPAIQSDDTDDLPF